MTELSDRYKEVDPVLIAKRAKQIRDIRFKVYMFICVIFLIFFWGIFISAVDRVRGFGAFDLKNIFSMGLKEAIFVNRGGGGLLNELDNVESRITDAEKEIAQARVVQDVIQELDNKGKQYTLANCLNFGDCEEVEQELLDNSDLLRAYIILGELSAEKMSFDQRMVLQSINEFILEPRFTNDGADLLGITFGTPNKVGRSNNLFQLGLTLELEIPSKAVLIELLERIENHISFDYPILYSIREMNYDIVEYGIAQRVTVDLVAYYYKDTTTPKPSGSQGESKDEKSLITGSPNDANTGSIPGEGSGGTGENTLMMDMSDNVNSGTVTSSGVTTTGRDSVSQIGGVILESGTGGVTAPLGEDE